jgi:CRP/FNR family transcriptional regulator, cyclic AMP receptor protein
MTPHERLTTLRVVAEFREIPPAELIALASAMREEVYEPGEPVCIEGEPADRIFIVHAGEVSVTQQGRSGVVQVAARGALFGEVAFFDRSFRTATVTTRTVCTVLSLEFERFRQFLLANPDSALVIAERLARMLRAAEVLLMGLQHGQRSE